MMNHHIRHLSCIIALMALGFGLSACANPVDHSTKTVAYASTLPYLQKLSQTHADLGTRLTVLDGKPLIVNQQGKLKQIGSPNILADGVSDVVAPVAGFGKVAFADTAGHFTLIENGRTYRSSMRLSPNSAMLMLPLAVIAVVESGDSASLVRLAVVDGQVKAVASFSPVLPDARPVQVSLMGDDGHIAVLSHPDDTTYRHGVLGDDVEARQLQWLERHSLTPLAKPLQLDGLVFEANTLQILPNHQGNRLITTIAGGHQGARAVVIDDIDDRLTVIAQSQPLPDHRWQSPFVFGGKLYAIQMPHLVGRLVAYHQTGDRLDEQVLGEGYSNHAIGAFNTNLVASTQHFAVIPHQGYRQVSLLRSDGKILPVEQTLPARIIESISSGDGVYLLLADGSVWQVGLS